MSILLALVLFAVQGDAGTLQVLEQRVAADPEDRQGAWELAYLYWRLERFDDAERLFRMSTDCFGEHAYSERMLGALAEERFRLHEAHAHYRRALELDATLPEVDADLRRVTSALADVARFRDAHARLRSGLLAVAVGWIVVLLSVGLLAFRARSSRGAPARS